MEYQIEDRDPYGAMLFTKVFVIKAECGDDDGYKEMAIWCCDNLQEPFVLLSYKTKIIAGGTSDNKNSYHFRKEEEEEIDGELISHYELRCMHKDAVIFKVRWA